MSMRKIVTTGPHELYVEERNGIIKITEVWYPLYPHSNNIKNVIEIDLENKTIKHYTVKVSWGGTGRSDHGYVELSDNELRDVIEIVKNIKSLNDFNTLKEKFNELKNEREKKIVEEYEKLTDELIGLIAADEKLRQLKSTDIKQFVKECIDSYLSDD